METHTRAVLLALMAVSFSGLAFAGLVSMGIGGGSIGGFITGSVAFGFGITAYIAFMNENDGRTQPDRHY